MIVILWFLGLSFLQILGLNQGKAESISSLEAANPLRTLDQRRHGNLQKKSLPIKPSNELIDLNLFPPDYDKRQHPPPEKEGEVSEILVTMDIYSIPQLDEKKEELMLEVRLSHYWYDTRLNVNFDQPLELEPDAINEFWVPDSYIHHAKEAKQVKVITNPASLRIYPNKVVKYSMMTMVTIGCPMSYQYYPMDRQTCRLEMQSFGFSILYNNYTWKRSPLLKKDINLDNHNVYIKEYYFTYSSDDTAGLKYPGLGIRIDLRRHLGHHIIQTYVPSVIFVTVAWLSFLVPSDVVPGRMVLCVTTLLTLTAMFSSVRSLTPQVSYMKAIDLWVFVCMCFVFSSLAEYGLILHLTSRSGWQKKIDSHLRNKTGKSKITSIELIAITMKGTRREQNRNETITAPKPGDPSIPNSKEKWAYAIEYGIKIAYPVLFFIFNLLYWIIYLRDYDEVLSSDEDNEDIFDQHTQ